MWSRMAESSAKSGVAVAGKQALAAKLLASVEVVPLDVRVLANVLACCWPGGGGERGCG